MRSAAQVGPWRPNAAGMTLIEVLVATVVAALFLLTLYALNSLVETGAARVRDMAIAAAYADHYLQWQTTDKTDRRTALTSTCGSTPSLVDLVANPSAAGAVIGTSNAADPDYPLPPPVSATWRGFFPAGCSATAPMLWTLTVVWGPNNTTVQQAIYVR